MKHNPKYRPVRKKRGLSRKQRKIATAWYLKNNLWRHIIDNFKGIMPFGEEHMHLIDESTRELIKMFGPAPEGKEQWTWFEKEDKTLSDIGFDFITNKNDGISLGFTKKD